MAGAGLYEVGPGKTYSTIQSALDQLWTDQGSADFTASQYIRVFADTYDENVVPNAGLVVGLVGGYHLIIEGDPSDSRGNIIISPSAGTYTVHIGCAAALVRHLKLTGTPSTGIVYSPAHKEIMVDDCIIQGASINIVNLSVTYSNAIVRDCEITLTAGNNYALVVAEGALIEGCEIVGSANNTGWGLSLRGATVRGCVISKFNVGMKLNLDNLWTSVSNCTLYDCTYGQQIDRALMNNAEAKNTIFKDVTYPWYLPQQWPEETVTFMGSEVVTRNNCYHGYTAFAYGPGAATKTHAEWIAFNRVDASGDLDATDPLLTNPAGGDFSLQAASPCRHAGHGSGVVSDVEGTAYDAHHPDIGAMSTGALTIATPTISTAVDDETGTSATLTLSAGNVQDVLSVHYRRRQETEWTTHGSTRTGSGSLQVTGLVRDQHYWFICTAARGGEVSLPSGAIGLTVTTGDWEATLEAAWRTRLLDNATVEGLLGVRLYGGVAPQDAELPYAVFTVISDVPWHHMEAASRLARARIQLDCYAESYAAVKALAKACREAVDGLDREVTVGSDTNALTIMLEMQADGDNERAAGAELGPYRVIQDYVVLHDETLPALA